MADARLASALPADVCEDSGHADSSQGERPQPAEAEDNRSGSRTVFFGRGRYENGFSARAKGAGASIAVQKLLRAGIELPTAGFPEGFACDLGGVGPCLVKRFDSDGNYDDIDLGYSRSRSSVNGSRTGHGVGGYDLEVPREAATDLASALCLGPEVRPARPTARDQPLEDAGPYLHGRDRNLAPLEP